LEPAVHNAVSAYSSLGVDVIPSSVVSEPGAEFGLTLDAAGRRLVVLAEAAVPWLGEFEGERTAVGGRVLLVGPLGPRNAAALRTRLAWLRPALIGLRTSAGFGDRLGRATPGHVRAVRATGGAVAPVFAQQSMREMGRTGRTPADVIDDAMWGVFAEGWRGGFGADADHLKTTDDVDRCVAGGFTGFTVDPGEHVWSGADTASAAEVQAAVEGLPWDVLEDSEPGLRARFLGRGFDVGSRAIRLEPGELARAAAKYGRAVALVVRIYRHLLTAAGAFELEVSVDETDSPTSHAEHFYVATELRRLGVAWVGLAPRYVGRFEKGVDYIGDLREFERDLAVHAEIARALGPYKLSLHSGSDKFAIYPMVARHTRGFVHLKTAGTSYLEALRAVASIDPGLFREIYRFCREHYDVDKATYHVSAELARAPLADEVSDDEAVAVVDQFDARQILHVTFGSVLTAQCPDGRRVFYDRFMAVLDAHPEVYAGYLESHFRRHLAPFVP
jgi:tagaturonate epimerase